MPSNTVPQLNSALLEDIALKYECSSGSVLLDARLLAAFQVLPLNTEKTKLVCDLGSFKLLGWTFNFTGT